MGCGVASAKTVDVESASGKQFKYTITVHTPQSDCSEHFVHRSSCKELRLTDLMNLLAFSNVRSDDLKASFHSVYSETSDRFVYYVGSLIGVKVDGTHGLPSEVQWMPMINQTKHTWNEVCECHYLVYPEDCIEWKLTKG